MTTSTSSSTVKGSTKPQGRSLTVRGPCRRIFVHMYVFMSWASHEIYHLWPVIIKRLREPRCKIPYFSLELPGSWNTYPKYIEEPNIIQGHDGLNMSWLLSCHICISHSSLTSLALNIHTQVSPAQGFYTCFPLILRQRSPPHSTLGNAPPSLLSSVSFMAPTCYGILF